ncbi:protein of unknown function [Methylotuvimicrobium alcaliphilum 20Z]|uniref:Tyr recombinase domain-containing protein n=1 Tax=Methylotuvimicrobium alcaliphilum (strain DSM 19304 / NCIMB 14124 / VKM B-2133 / 20Z) TaxID=1091494 RepID=G4SUP6_META2|nr:protein of unknown function [Methylotuvimicrobium alcaliphilum 20Z]
MPVVLSLEEIKQVLQRVEGVAQLVVKLLYGSGLRITETENNWGQVQIKRRPIQYHSTRT